MLCIYCIFIYILCHQYIIYIYQYIAHSIGHTRLKRASSFSIGKGGKITRTAMLPEQINSKIVKGGNGKKHGSIANLHHQSQSDSHRKSRSNYFTLNSVSSTNSKYK